MIGIEIRECYIGYLSWAEVGLKGLKSEGVLRYGVLRCRKTRSKGLALFMFEKALPPCESSDTQILHNCEESIRTCASAKRPNDCGKGPTRNNRSRK